MADALPIMLNADELDDALSLMIDIRRAAMVWGPPGIGKSRKMADLSTKLGIGLRDIRALLMNPVDVNGLPHVQFQSDAVAELVRLFRAKEVPSIDSINAIFKKRRTRAMQELEKLFAADAPDNDAISQVLNQTSEVDLYGQTVWSRPGFLPSEGRGILLFDEINAAPPEVQAALYQVMLDFKVGEHVMASGWVPFAAGNRESDKGVAYRMPTPLSDRMFHFDLVVEFGPWERWAVDNDIHPLVVAYLQVTIRDDDSRSGQAVEILKRQMADAISRPGFSFDSAQDLIGKVKRQYSDGVGMLHRFDPKERSFPTPRSWEMVSDALKKMEDRGLEGTQVERAVIAGKVGRVAAEEMLAFAITFRKGWTIGQALMNPDTCVVPEEPSMLCAVAGALARNVTTRNIGNGIKYVLRLPEEYRVMFIKQATERDPTLANTSPVTKFMVDHREIMA